MAIPATPPPMMMVLGVDVDILSVGKQRRRDPQVMMPQEIQRCSAARTASAGERTICKIERSAYIRDPDAQPSPDDNIAPPGNSRIAIGSIFADVEN
jgi:hypothetical protein